jgi:hypothetical protein
MKYTVSIEIALPRERAVQLLADPAQLPKWLRGLVLQEPAMPKIPHLLRIPSPSGEAIALTVAEWALPGAGMWPALFAAEVTSHCHAAAIHERAVLRSLRRV